MTLKPRFYLLLAALVASGNAGCTSTAQRCADSCDWTKACAGDPANDCQRQCEDDYDQASDRCRDAFDAFADCMSDANLVCSTVESQCREASTNFTTDCKGQF